MRIVAGKWGGRRIVAPAGRETRPTADRTREAMFSSILAMLGSLAEVHVADVYAGSGALGLEALSRGAASCTFVESEDEALRVIRRNAEELGVGPGEARFVRAALGHSRPRLLWVEPVSLLLADPPYRIDAAEFGQVLAGLASGGFLKTGALVVYEHGASTEARWPAGFAERSVRRYGDSAVSFATYEG
ncbi:MAG: 16S rRNA (guanine(966)-N(2))-methyltransferase RsmD [Actinobacteria bacterium]|nr:16S rRNA (guanine(966)-N(2))-methyltransferase RsmD [Actinomycetota bacterium]